jgi:hypothetical protein
VAAKNDRMGGGKPHENLNWQNKGNYIKRNAKKFFKSTVIPFNDKVAL